MKNRNQYQVLVINNDPILLTINLKKCYPEVFSTKFLEEPLRMQSKYQVFLRRVSALLHRGITLVNW